MEQWHCFKCKEKMVEGDIPTIYLDLETDYSIEGIKCPKCGAAYLLEKKVVEEVAPGEQLMESK